MEFISLKWLELDIRICDSYESFFTRHHQLTCRLVLNRAFYMTKGQTSYQFKGFCSRYPEIFSKFKVSIRKHAEDGICLPTVAINSLSNKVSISQIEQHKGVGILNSLNRIPYSRKLWRGF